MRKLCVAGATAALALLTSPALAAGPSGSTEGESGTDQYNRVTCGEGVDTAPGGRLYVGAEGVETCGPNGRLIVSADGYVAADGTAENPVPLDGWVRVDGSGVTCSPDDPGDATVQEGEACAP